MAKDNVVQQLRSMASSGAPTKETVGLMAAVVADIHDNVNDNISDQKDYQEKTDTRLDKLESKDKKEVAVIAGATSIITSIIILVGQWLATG